MIKGFIGTSLIDYPSQISAVVFTGGCNFVCPFCQNASLVLPDKLQFQPDIPEAEIVEKIKARSNFIDGVVISGGEPTIHNDQLICFIQDLKRINSCKKSLLVKLDTNGSNPEFVKKGIEEGWLDYVAMDLKTSIDQYDEVTKLENSYDKVRQTMGILFASSIGVEIRTTVVPGLIDMDKLIEMGEMIKDCKLFVLQGFRPKGVIDPAYEKIEPYPASYLHEAAEKLKNQYSFETIVRF